MSRRQPTTKSVSTSSSWVVGSKPRARQCTWFISGVRCCRKTTHHTGRCGLHPRPYVMPCPCGFDPPELVRWSLEWHLAHKPFHILVFPEIADDARTLDNLDAFIRLAERRVGSTP